MEAPDRVSPSPGALSLSRPPPSPFLGKCISYSVCNVGPFPGVGWGVQGRRRDAGWGPPLPGVELGGNCIETFLPKQGRRAAVSPSPSRAGGGQVGRSLGRGRP